MFIKASWHFSKLSIFNGQKSIKNVMRKYDFKPSMQLETFPKVSGNAFICWMTGEIRASGMHTPRYGQ